MFDFFKRKKTDGPTPTPEMPAPESVEPVQTPPAQPVAAPEVPPPDALLDRQPEPEAAAEAPKRSWADRLRAGLGRSREKFSGALAGVFARKTLDEATLEELETALLTADVGVAATEHLLDDLRERFRRSGGTGDPRTLLKAAILDLIGPLEQPLVITDARPFVIMIAGVNGSGKTTSIGKLARYFQEQGHAVMLAAGDTFRAAAREQLVIWGERNNVPVISQAGGDPAAVMFDAVAAARSRGTDVLLADTAGRLPTQLHLMEEIRKVKRVIAKADPSAPHEVLLVLDANTGQNAVAQVKAFDEALGLTGLVLTKLDGTAKGGTVCAIAKERPIPLRFIGVGEGIEDLRPFVASDFVDALLG
ncbi:MAG TPA: signal recognition particle-docking protein FtsY [Casimicrobiaceae bacterium]|nr:signal recognition particle-docking protein FtsY [Casimicrobiaceae bacterium]